LSDMTGLQRADVKRAYPMADKLDQPPFLEQMNPYESIFSP